MLAWFHALKLNAGQRIFVPLCGKTLDIGWLLAQGLRVAGAELSELAVRELFDELGAVPNIEPLGPLKRFRTDNLDVFVGDIFELDATGLGAVDGVYDRAALVALPHALRAKYAAHLVCVTCAAPQLTVCFDYDSAVMDGPPFPVLAEEMTQLYAAHYALERLADVEVAGGLKGVCPAREQVWLLQPEAS